MNDPSTNKPSSDSMFSSNTARSEPPSQVETQATTIAVTGATGFIGSRLCEKLLDAGFKVKALYRSSPVGKLEQSDGIEWVKGQLNDAAALSALLEDASALVHCAGAVRGKNRADFDRVNVVGTWAAINAANTSSTCQRFVQISSLAAREPELSDYAASKRAGERLLETSEAALNWMIVRPPAVYGPGDKEMLPVFNSMVKGLVPVPGAAQGRLSLIYVDDLVDAIIKWLRTDPAKCVNARYEIDDGREAGYDWNILLTQAAEALKKDKPIRRLSIPASVLRLFGYTNLAASRLLGYSPMLTPGKVSEITHSDWVCHDNPIFEQVTGWQPTTTFKDGLLKTLNHSSDT
ncbi:3 beta-hydroxysteroid dehydrogenase/Delta 5--_4-isomerase [Halomonadaceae bacterium LMG 33818]|uniref:NAD-dependent epimerase/dehydratase family protein n=1 Tax=Cernens ardua TaxID=3402176 RepID=UPI003EDC7FC1